MGPSYVASAAADLGARVIHVSTDFVFDGTKSVPYVESDAPHPLSVYGDTKLTGERNASPAVIVRTSWLFGADGPCFPKTMIRAHQAGKSLRVVADQFGTPTFTQELARVFGDIISNNLPDGIYHAAGPESMSWYEFAKRVLSSWAGTDVDVTPIRTEDWPTPAIRPKQSALSMDKLESLGIAKMEPLAKTLPTFCTTLRASESR
jgi:dTDP-4-dehydrorhamnose reductase